MAFFGGSANAVTGLDARGCHIFEIHLMIKITKQDLTAVLLGCFGHSENDKRLTSVAGLHDVYHSRTLADSLAKPTQHVKH